MKIKALSRSLDNHAPARLGDPTPISRNLDPALHPFDKPREYTRALNAAKLDRMFAKPFVAAMDGHIDGVYAMAKDPNRLGVIASGSGDGEIRLWDLAQQSCLWTYPRAHSGIVQSLTLSPLPGARRILSCSTDRTVKLWDADPNPDRLGYDLMAGVGGDDEGAGPSSNPLGGGREDMPATEPLTVFSGKTAFNSVTHHRTNNIFASSSTNIQIWDESRTSPISTMTWGPDTIQCVRFNQSETSVLASAGSDRGVVLYDMRSGKPLSKMVMQMRANDISWSPLEPTTFAIASEDQNVYTFDMRNLSSATQILKDHVAAVMSVDWSPTGTDIVSGSYDRTVRLWEKGKGRSRDVYHTKRMQRIFSVLYTLDARYVCTGSDDGNVRLWKARASEKLGILGGREMAAREYRQGLRTRWQAVGDVGRIERQRHVPKPIKSAQQLKRTMLDARRVKEENRRKHTKAGSKKPKAARKEAILAQQ